MENIDKVLAPSTIKQTVITDTDILIDEIISSVRTHNPSANTDQIYIAYRLAKHSHKNQFRQPCFLCLQQVQSLLLLLERHCYNPFHTKNYIYNAFWLCSLFIYVDIC